MLLAEYCLGPMKYIDFLAKNSKLGLPNASWTKVCGPSWMSSSSISWMGALSTLSTILPWYSKYVYCSWLIFLLQIPIPFQRKFTVYFCCILRWFLEVKMRLKVLTINCWAIPGSIPTFSSPDRFFFPFLHFNWGSNIMWCRRAIIPWSVQMVNSFEFKVFRVLLQIYTLASTII